VDVSHGCLLLHWGPAIVRGLEIVTMHYYVDEGSLVEFSHVQHFVLAKYVTRKNRILHLKKELWNKYNMYVISYYDTNEFIYLYIFSAS
jgi:hypothetical protein